MYSFDMIQIFALQFISILKGYNCQLMI